MASLLLKNADIIVCMDDAGRELQTGSIYCRDGMIEAVGAAEDLPDSADRVIDMTGKIIIPGLVNTHHHLFQNLTRVLPAAQNATLFGWLTSLYPIWQNLRPDQIASAVSVGLAELALSGCTTSSDHQYLYPNGARLDDSIEAALQLGMRFVATRGSMSIGVSKGGLPPDSLVEEEAAILKDCERVVHAYHDPKKAR